MGVKKEKRDINTTLFEKTKPQLYSSVKITSSCGYQRRAKAALPADTRQKRHSFCPYCPMKINIFGHTGKSVVILTNNDKCYLILDEATQ